jgi:hypothetical protein
LLFYNRTGNKFLISKSLAAGPSTAVSFANKWPSGLRWQKVKRSTEISLLGALGLR